MNENNILNLINKFEKSLEETEKLTTALMGLETTLGKLDSSISEVYELTKVEDISKKSNELIDNIGKLKSIQQDVNTEFNELINLKLYKDGLKEDIFELKNYLINIDKEIVHIKKDIKDQNSLYKLENEKLKKDIVSSIKAILNQSEELSMDKEVEHINEYTDTDDYQI